MEAVRGSYEGYRIPKLCWAIATAWMRAAEESSTSLPIRRIPDEGFNRSLARNPVECGDGRDIVDSVDGDAFLVRDRIGQRPDFLTLIVGGRPKNGWKKIC